MVLGKDLLIPGGSSMGMFDDVKVISPVIKCSYGHVLTDFQTKDLNCSLGQFTIDGTIQGIGGPFWPEDNEPILDTIKNIVIYGTCYQCPVFIDGKVGNVVPMFVEFAVSFDPPGGPVKEVRMISKSTDEWIEDEKNYQISTPHYELYRLIGPMDYASAARLRDLMRKINRT